MFQVFDVPRGRPGMEFAFRWLCLPVLLATLCVSPSGGGYVITNPSTSGS
jgi:hypothetical protein